MQRWRWWLCRGNTLVTWDIILSSCILSLSFCTEQNPNTLSWMWRDLPGVAWAHPSWLPRAIPAFPLLPVTQELTYFTKQLWWRYSAFTLEWGKASSESPRNREGPVRSFSSVLNSQPSYFMCIVNYIHANKSVSKIPIEPVSQLSRRGLKKKQLNVANRSHGTCWTYLQNRNRLTDIENRLVAKECRKERDELRVWG